MIRKEQLLGIRELRLAGIINTMTDRQFADYVQTLDAFIDNFPKYAENLTSALETSQYSLLGKRLSELYDILTKLHADSMASQCLKQIKLLAAGTGQSGMDVDELDAFIENLIQSVSALSIDIQMAAHKGASSPAPRRGVRTSSNRASILAVDNAVMFLNTLKKLLSGAPYDLFCMSSASEALDFLQSNRPDVILLDIEMPDMDGYELARRIRKGGNKSPIIFITANSAREYVDKAVEVGADGLLMKPLRINQLLAKLKEVL